MKNKRLMAFLVTTITAAALYAGTPFEDDLKTWDPYVADTEQGFDSIFVNPAGMAGQSSFVASVETGTFGQLEDYARVQDFIDFYNAFNDAGGSMSLSTAENMVEIMQDNMTQEMANDLFADTPLAMTDIDTLDAADLEGLTPEELQTIADNYASAEPGTFEEIFDIHYDIAVESRVGFLLGGIGGGVYYRQSFPFSAGDAGFTMMKSEIGAIAGAGFNFGPIALGASMNYGLLLTYPEMTMDQYGNIGDVPMLYGYAWGVDAGAIWNITDSLSLGLVFNDIIGSTVDDAGETTMNQLLDGTYVDEVSFDYEFTFDVDVGLTWQPDWKFFSPKFSVDYYDVVGLIRYLEDNGEDMEDQAIARMIFNQLRIGTQLKLLETLTVGAQYYNNFFSVGAGLKILAVEVGLEVVFEDAFLYSDYNDQSQVGANLLIRFKL